MSCSHILPSSRGETHASLSPRGGLRVAGPFPPRARSALRWLPGPWPPVLVTASAARPARPPARPCVRSVPPRLAVRAAGGLPPSLGELGAGLRACASSALRPAGRGAGNGSLSFPGAGLCFLPTLLPRPGGKLGFTFPGTLGEIPSHPTHLILGSGGRGATCVCAARGSSGQDAPRKF